MKDLQILLDNDSAIYVGLLSDGYLNMIVREKKGVFADVVLNPSQAEQLSNGVFSLIMESPIPKETTNG